MQILRLILWIVSAALMVGFMLMNWGDTYQVTVLPALGGEPVLADWPIGFVALVFFLIGFLPTWLLSKGMKWRLNRRIKNLEAQLGRAAENDRAEVQNALARKDAEKAIFDAEASGASTYKPTAR